MVIGFNKKGDFNFGGTVATIGAILIFIGFSWLVAINWASIPDPFKVVILLLATAVAYTVGVLFRINEHPKIGESLLILGALLYGLSIFLIAQMYNLGVDVQSQANLFLLAWIGILIVAYVFSSSSSLVIALSGFLAWIGWQYFALADLFTGADFAIGVLAIIYLIIGVLLYGLTQIHKSRDHHFASVYRYWTAFYILLLTYILSFQTLLPLLWPEGFNIGVGTLIFLLVLGVIAIVAAIIGIFMSLDAKKLTGKEVVGFLVLLVLYVLLISVASLVSGHGGFFGGRNIGTGLWMLWIFDNILFIFVILSVIGYGTRYKSTPIINLAISFFVIDIITRYIGFWMDLAGAWSFAVMSIIGGIILIFGGWGIEKWREGLLQKARQLIVEVLEAEGGVSPVVRLEKILIQEQ